MTQSKVLGYWSMRPCNLSLERTVPMTVLPASNNWRVISFPNPELTPVMSQVFAFSIMHPFGI